MIFIVKSYKIPRQKKYQVYFDYHPEFVDAIKELDKKLRSWNNVGKCWEIQTKGLFVLIKKYKGSDKIFFEFPEEGAKEKFIEDVKKIHLDEINEKKEKERLEKNKIEWVNECINQLDIQANEIIEENAKYVFLSTAISQNGIFDSIIILIAQVKMIWQILHIYYQRPNLKSILSLYTNIVITIFTVKAIEDFEFIERQIEPIVASILGSSITPGFNVTALLLINSLISGTANAFLTLRIGLIAQKYSSPIIMEEKSHIKKNANLEASKMLGKVISGSIVLLTKSIGKASINATKRFGEGSKNKAKEFKDQTKEVTKNIIDSIKNKIS